MKFIVGKKIEMTQIWKDDKAIAVTKVQAGPCTISQVKDETKDGYQAVQLAFGDRKEKRIKKPQKNHFKKAGLRSAKILKEFRIDDAGELKAGDVISVDTFTEGDKINVSGVSKGKGFAGVVKRHGFHGSRKTHGNKDQLRMPGSIGSTGPAHVFKGVRMAGRMGGEKTTTQNLEIVGVDKDNDILLIKGAVPGARNSFVYVVADGELKVDEKKVDEKKEEPKEKELETNKDPEDAAKVEEKGEEAPKTEEKKEEKDQNTSVSEEKKN